VWLVYTWSACVLVLQHACSLACHSFVTFYSQRDTHVTTAVEALVGFVLAYRHICNFETLCGWCTHCLLVSWCCSMHALSLVTLLSPSTHTCDMHVTTAVVAHALSLYVQHIHLRSHVSQVLFHSTLSRVSHGCPMCCTHACALQASLQLAPTGGALPTRQLVLCAWRYFSN
jgi:hypothetical protein